MRPRETLNKKRHRKSICYLIATQCVKNIAYIIHFRAPHINSVSKTMLFGVGHCLSSFQTACPFQRAKIMNYPIPSKRQTHTLTHRHREMPTLWFELLIAILNAKVHFSYDTLFIAENEAIRGIMTNGFERINVANRNLFHSYCLSLSSNFKWIFDKFWKISCLSTFRFHQTALLIRMAWN